MSLLVIRMAGEEDRVFRIRGKRIAIGRDAAADLVLPDAAVSRLHACLESDGARCELVDQGSTNGVKVNGDTVERRRLEHGDVVRIGKYRLEYCDERKVDLFQVTRLARLRSSRPHSLHANMSTLCFQTSELDVPSPAELRSAQAVLVSCDPGGGRWRLGNGRLTIGPGGDVPVAMDLTSQPVAEILWDGEHHVLRAWSWAQRVEVNGRRIREATLEPGAQIQVDEACFEFVHEPCAAQTS